jgi:hypothetical protein
MEQPIGILGYFWDELDDGLWVEVAFVAPEQRCRGVYKSLFDRLRVLAERKGAAWIRSGIHQNNYVMLRAAVRTGRRLTPMSGEPYFAAVMMV